MAKKKLFGNHKEPRCETCANGKLTADGKTVLCRRGGALPLSHSCRRYVYDPLRRVPKRRPLLGEYSAADFALDAYTKPEILAEEPSAAAAPAAVSEHQTLDRVFAYLNSHDTPDTDTILAILRNWDTVTDEESADTAPATDAPLPDAKVPAEDTATDDAEGVPETATEVSSDLLTEVATTDNDSVVEEIVEDIPADGDTDADVAVPDVTPSQSEVLSPLLQPDDSPDIFGDLARLTLRDTSHFAFCASDFDDDEDLELFTLSKDALPSDVVLTPREYLEEDLPLQIDEMVIFSPQESDTESF